MSPPKLFSTHSSSPRKAKQPPRLLRVRSSSSGSSSESSIGRAIRASLADNEDTTPDRRSIGVAQRGSSKVKNIRRDAASESSSENLGEAFSPPRSPPTPKQRQRMAPKASYKPSKPAAKPKHSLPYQRSSVDVGPPPHGTPPPKSPPPSGSPRTPPPIQTAPSASRLSPHLSWHGEPAHGAKRSVNASYVDSSFAEHDGVCAAAEAPPDYSTAVYTYPETPYAYDRGGFPCSTVCQPSYYPKHHLSIPTHGEKYLWQEEYEPSVPRFDPGMQVIDYAYGVARPGLKVRVIEDKRCLGGLFKWKEAYNGYIVGHEWIAPRPRRPPPPPPEVYERYVTWYPLLLHYQSFE